ncbi:serine protease, partial [Vibrio parahaemolyticus]|nr:serine protease [Vibrio parahaemolyticus]
LYSPVMSGQKAFYTASVRFTDDNRNVPVTGFDDTSLAASRNYFPVTYKTWRAELALGYQETLWREFKIGGRYSDGSANYSTLPDYADMNFTRQGIFFNYRIDSLDDFSMPREGVYLDFEYLVSHDDVDLTESGVAENSSDTVYELSTKLI